MRQAEKSTSGSHVRLEEREYESLKLLNGKLVATFLVAG